MRKLFAVSLLFGVAVACAVRAQQAQTPSGPTLDFTLNYINSSLVDGLVSFDGTNVTFRLDKGRETRSFDIADVGGVSAGSDDAGQNVSICCNGSMCVHVIYSKRGLGGDYQNFVKLYVKGDSFKAQDVANAFKHLFKLMMAENAAQIHKEQQQNQSDPFDRPQ